MTLKERIANWLTGGAYLRIFNANTDLSVENINLTTALRERDNDIRIKRGNEVIYDQEVTRHKQALDRTAQAMKTSDRHLKIAENALIHKDAEIKVLKDGLHEIISLQTPKANATVRNMAALAQHTLDRFGEPRSEPFEKRVPNIINITDQTIIDVMKR